ncbi:MAG: ABC-three component system middle component 6 [bacterium]
MILPQKHISIYESLLGLSNYISLKLNEKNYTIDEMWSYYQKINHTKKFPAKHNFNEFILAIDLLYSLKRVKLNSEGKLQNEIN